MSTDLRALAEATARNPGRVDALTRIAEQLAAAAPACIERGLRQGLDRDLGHATARLAASIAAGRRLDAVAVDVRSWASQWADRLDELQAVLDAEVDATASLLGPTEEAA